MVARVVKTDKKTTTFGDEEIEVEDGQKKQKKSYLTNGYPKAFKKIASISGTTRIMKCKSGCGEFDDIINIYVDENGLVTPSKIVVMNAKGNDDVNPKNVERQDLTYWGGNPRAVTAEYRKKKTSRPIKRRKFSKRKS